MNGLMDFLEILGTIAFSISGALEAMKKKMDLLGVIVLGVVTAVGGGIIRDIVIGKVPPQAFQNPRCAEIAIGVSLIAFIVGKMFSKRHREIKVDIWNILLLVSDAIGLATFTILGIKGVEEWIGADNKALLLFVGVVTGVGGGLMRDIFAGDVPYIFKKHVYATASIAGAVSYLLLDKTELECLAVFGSMFLVVIIRLLAAYFKWNLPKADIDMAN